ncbi:hypothetical protein A2U01_0119436, partial [Trifolium medium]|nr:hypothetical protein [Trifolium medium]
AAGATIRASAPLPRLSSVTASPHTFSFAAIVMSNPHRPAAAAVVNNNLDLVFYKLF